MHCMGVQVWASASDDGLLAVPSLTAGINTASLPVPASCTLGCTADLLITWPSTMLPPTLPLAALFDPGAPVVQSAQNSNGGSWPIDVQQPTLQPEVSIGGPAAEAVVEPLTNFTLTLDVSQCATAAAASCGNALTEAAEVVVLAVDKAWLLLQPYALPDPAALFDVDLSPFLQAAVSTEGNVNPDAISLWRQVCPHRRSCPLATTARPAHGALWPGSTLMSHQGCVCRQTLKSSTWIPGLDCWT